MDSNGMTKSQRLRTIEHLLASNLGGISRVELSRRLRVNKSTITRDIQELSLDLPLVEDSRGRLILHKRDYRSFVELTLFEMEALHLSARLFARTMRFPFPHASAALRKLAEAQKQVSRVLSERIQGTAEEIDALNLLSDRDSLGYRLLVEELGVAISDSRPISFHYRSAKSTQDSANPAGKLYRVFPITLEPHFEGRSVYLIALLLNDSKTEDPMDSAQALQNFRTFNLEHMDALQIEQPNPTLLQFSASEWVRNRMFHAWSIWSTNRDPVEVRLLFTGEGAIRLVQTLWHPTQVLEPQDDGSVMWTAHISEPLEMYPWIRGWGPDVQVLAPESLRQRHIDDFRRGADVYGICT